jgi:MerR family transcriptional regulator, thiopeptide resistance regulator
VDDEMEAMSRLYKAREFAELAGVTVRALHHYDRIGILKPQRSSSGYRLYSLADLERLEQITALKFLGIPLREIKILLRQNPLTLAQSLDLQRRALTEKRDLMARAIHAIEAAEELVRSGQATDASLLRKIIEVIEMRPEENYMRKYHSEEAWTRRKQIMQEMDPELRERFGALRKQLFLEIESALDLDPASEVAQSLAKRWILLSEMITGADPGVKAAAIEAWKDHRNWPPEAQDAMLDRYGLSVDNREESMRRVEKVAKFIGQAIGRKYYGVLQETRLGPNGKSSVDRSSEEWVALFRDVEASLAEDPAGERAQSLAVRWRQLAGDSAGARTAPHPTDFQVVLQQEPQPNASVAVINQVARGYRIEQVANASIAVVNQVARVYRIEQVASFLAKAVASRPSSG